MNNTQPPDGVTALAPGQALRCGLTAPTPAHGWFFFWFFCLYKLTLKPISGPRGFERLEPTLGRIKTLNLASD